MPHCIKHNFIFTVHVGCKLMELDCLACLCMQQNMYVCNADVIMPFMSCQDHLEKKAAGRAHSDHIMSQLLRVLPCIDRSFSFPKLRTIAGTRILYQHFAFPSADGVVARRIPSESGTLELFVSMHASSDPQSQSSTSASKLSLMPLKLAALILRTSRASTNVVVNSRSSSACMHSRLM